MAEGRTSYYWICDRSINSELIPGLCSVEILIQNYTDNDVNEIRKLHNERYGEAVERNFEDGKAYIWKKNDTVVEIFIPKEGDQLEVNVHDRGVYNRLFN